MSRTTSTPRCIGLAGRRRARSLRGQRMCGRSGSAGDHRHLADLQLDREAMGEQGDRLLGLRHFAIRPSWRPAAAALCRSAPPGRTRLGPSRLAAGGAVIRKMLRKFLYSFSFLPKRVGTDRGTARYRVRDVARRLVGRSEAKRFLRHGQSPRVGFPMGSDADCRIFSIAGAHRRAGVPHAKAQPAQSGPLFLGNGADLIDVGPERRAQDGIVGRPLGKDDVDLQSACAGRMGFMSFVCSPRRARS